MTAPAPCCSRISNSTRRMPEGSSISDSWRTPQASRKRRSANTRRPLRPIRSSLNLTPRWGSSMRRPTEPTRRSPNSKRPASLIQQATIRRRKRRCGGASLSFSSSLLRPGSREAVPTPGSAACSRPGTPPADLILTGQIAEANYDPDDAATAYKRALAQDPVSAGATSGLAHLLLNEKEARGS